MRLPSVRFTVRGIMIAIAGVALALGAERGARRSADFSTRADYHESRLQTLALIRQNGVYPYCSLGISGIPLHYDAETAPLHARCVLYHTRMLRKYQRAMWLPWLAVDPDPPPPYPVLQYFEYGRSTR
jgi:hypothetical protein